MFLHILRFIENIFNLLLSSSNLTHNEAMRIDSALSQHKTGNVSTPDNINCIIKNNVNQLLHNTKHKHGVFLQNKVRSL